VDSILTVHLRKPTTTEINSNSVGMIFIKH